jgi:hypothetical protein
MKDYGSGKNSCTRLGSKFRCTAVKTVTSDVYDLASDVERVCENLERLVA